MTTVTSPCRRAPRAPCQVPSYSRPWAFTLFLFNLLTPCIWGSHSSNLLTQYDDQQLRTPYSRLLDLLSNPQDVTNPFTSPELGGGDDETPPSPRRLRSSRRPASVPLRTNPTEPYRQWPPLLNDPSTRQYRLNHYIPSASTSAPPPLDPMHDATCECAMLDPNRVTPLNRRCVNEHTAAQKSDTPPVRYECNSRTCSYDDCANRRLARQDFPPLKLLDTPGDRGRGLFADCTIPAHTLIGPYYGQLIRESDRRQLALDWARTHGGDGSARTA